MASPPSDQWTSTVVLADGDMATIRPLTPADRDALLAFHQRQSSDSIYKRYFSAKPTLTDAELDHFTNVDMVDRAAVAVELHGEFVGWASYERWPNRNDAEAAFMVDDEHQGKGIATLTLEHLAAIARSNGIDRFTAEVLADNRPMLTVFARAGWPVERHFDSGIVDLNFDLDDTAEYRDSVERREQRADSRAMARVLLPRSVAVIGASDTPGSIGQALWRHAAGGFGGPLYAVNPNRETVGGKPAYASVRDIGEEVSLALVAVPQTLVERVIDECIEARVRGAIIVTAIDHPSVDVPAMVARARSNGLRIIGPASMGAASPRADVGIQAALVDVRLPAGGVAISLQSGTLGASVLRLAQQLELGISWFVSLGDKCDVSGNDLLQFWLDDEATTVVAMYTESFGNPRKFARIARRVSQRRPVVAVRTGAAMIGPGAGALYQQAGLIEVPTVTAMLDTARVLATQPIMQGPRVAVVSNSHSPWVLATAALRTAGLEPVQPPTPVTWRSTDDDYRTAIRDALASDDVDALLVIHAPPLATAVRGPVDEIDEAAGGASKPIVAVMLGATDGPLRPGSPIATFAFPEPAAAVLGRLWSYGRWRATEGSTDVETLDGLDTDGAADVIAAILDEGRHDATSGEIRAMLATYGVEMPEMHRVPASDAVDMAEAIGYPVAVKAVRRGVGRTAQAGVGLDLANADDVRAAVEVMQQHLGDGAAEVLVQQMAPAGLDIRIRVTSDPQLGAVVGCGLGGAQADVIGDVVNRLAPLSPSTALAMIEATRARAALDADSVARLAETLVRVGRLVADHPEIDELDLNPVIVSAAGCWVTDAVARVQQPDRFNPALRRLE